jgi:DnaJ-class molecular chaperone
MGATKDASAEELKKLYKKAALKWHPDRWAGKSEQEQGVANETFQKINRAFEVLSDPQKRQR